MPELAYVNGVFLPIGEATVSIEDRSYQFGDGVYEVIVAYDGRLFLPEKHLQRLRRSADAIGLDYDFDACPLEPTILEGLSRCGYPDAMIYVQLSRGTAPRAHAIPEGIKPTVVMTFKECPVVPRKLLERGASVLTTPDTRWAKCYVKAVTLLPNVLAKTDAIRRGFDDAVFISESGEVRECTSANIFMVKDARLRFPPRTEAVLHGITQGFLLECAAATGIDVDEQTSGVEWLRNADEVFMSGTGVEVLGITSIDGRPVGDGKVGPITRNIHEEFKRRVRGATAAARP